jgi:F-type H+-transporting ATPase subunit a
MMPGKELPEISMAAEIIPVELPIPGFHHGVPNTLPTAIITALILVIIAAFYFRAVRKAEKTGQESNFLILMDSMFEAVYGFIENVAGNKFAKEVFPIIATFFLFILAGNWLGLVPGMGSIGVYGEHHGKEILIPLFRSPNADLSTTMGLAIISLVATQYVGFKHQGFKYLKKFFNFSAPPDATGFLKPVLAFANGFAGILELIAEFIKIFSFAFRLFGNVFAGEVLLMVISFLAAFIAVVPFMGLELFVGLIQALIFSMLSLIFFRMATHHH